MVLKIPPMGEFKMKSWSSRSAALMLGASLIALTACDEPTVDASIYDSVAQCEQDPANTADQCESSFEEARSQHASVAPKYATTEDCQADFGTGNRNNSDRTGTYGGFSNLPCLI